MYLMKEERKEKHQIFMKLSNDRKTQINISFTLQDKLHYVKEQKSLHFPWRRFFLTSCHILTYSTYSAKSSDKEIYLVISCISPCLEMGPKISFRTFLLSTLPSQVRLLQMTRHCVVFGRTENRT